MARATRERRGFWFRLCILVIWPLAQVLTRRDRHGLEHLPATGGALVVANHVSAFDPLTIAQLVFDGGRLPHFLAKESLFRAFFLGRVMRGTEQIPVRRDTADAALALSAAVEALRGGRLVIIYPEGTTTRDPDLWPMRARTGVARLALTADVPVLPLAQWGAQHIHRKGGRLHPFSHPTVQAVLGPPLDLSPWRGLPQTPDVLREVTDHIMGAVADILGDVRGEQRPQQPWDPRRAAGTARKSA